jgi:hypothetical protein
MALALRHVIPSQSIIRQVIPQNRPPVWRKLTEGDHPMANVSFKDVCKVAEQMGLGSDLLESFSFACRVLEELGPSSANQRRESVCFSTHIWPDITGQPPSSRTVVRLRCSNLRSDKAHLGSHSCIFLWAMETSNGTVSRIRRLLA